MSEKNIYQRINAVMKKVKYVQKDKQVSGGGQNYKAVTHDQVVSVCRQALVDEGVAIIPSQISHEMLVMRDVKNDIKMHLYEADYCIDFVNIDKPEDMIHVNISSQSQDNGDKAPGKALSYAVKYAILKVLCLETGENDESRAEAYATLTPAQIKGVSNLIGDSAELESAMLVALNVESVEEIKRSDYNRVVARLKKSKGE